MENYSDIKYAELEKAPTEKPKAVWFGIHKGVRFEINKTTPVLPKYFTESWTYYLWLPIDDMFDKETADKFWLEPVYHKYSENGPEHVIYRYYDSIIWQIDMHGGCTWYSKESTVDDKKRLVKFGCDYSHLWDEGKTYTLESVYSDVKNSINSLLELVGKIKIRSWGDEKYRFIEEFTC